MRHVRNLRVGLFSKSIESQEEYDRTKLPAIKPAILTFTLIAMLMLTAAAASVSTETNIGSSGTIQYPGLFLVNFENNDLFKWGIDGNGTGYMLYGSQYSGTVPFWSRGGYGASRWPSWLLFENETSIVHSGARSAKLSIVDPSFDGGRRLEILHDMDPHVEYLWNIGWYYFPSSLNPTDAWITFHRIVYERMWDQDRAVYFQQFQISLSLITDGRSETGGQQIFCLSLGKGDIDNNDDGVGETWPYVDADLYSNRGASKNVPSSWLTKKPGLQVPFDRWFKVEALVFRNLTDYNKGYVKLWIDGELVWDVQGTRTLGIDPAVLEGIDQIPPEPQGYMCTGFGLYTDGGSKPKSIYADDISISKFP